MSSIRYRAADREVARSALLAMIRYARQVGGETSFHPWSLVDILKTGLVVEGPEGELSRVREVLGEVEGLVEVDR